eukprot:Nk52_evm16s230 gene=Nk52_evmTU16s230
MTDFPKNRMKSCKILILLAVYSSFLLAQAQATEESRSEPGGKVVYGTNDLKEAYTVSTDSNKVVLEPLVAATGALVRSKYIGTSTISSSGAFTKYLTNDLCTTEPFYGQTTLPFCTGWLISSTRMATAGHCLTQQSSCDDTKIVFGFQINQSSNSYDFNNVDFATNVYSCKTLLSRQQYNILYTANDGTTTIYTVDYAVFELDRAVAGRSPLTLDTSKQAVDTRLAIAGFPFGLPLKVDANGNIKTSSEVNYKATLDSYQGNSGSAVVNYSTGKVTGALVTGQVDFVKSASADCYVSHECSLNGCGSDGTAFETLITTSQLAAYVDSPSSVQNIQVISGGASRFSYQYLYEGLFATSQQFKYTVKNNAGSSRILGIQAQYNTNHQTVLINGQVTSGYNVTLDAGQTYDVTVLPLSGSWPVNQQVVLMFIDYADGSVQGFSVLGNVAATKICPVSGSTTTTLRYMNAATSDVWNMQTRADLWTTCSSANAQVVFSPVATYVFTVKTGGTVTITLPASKDLLATIAEVNSTWVESNPKCASTSASSLTSSSLTYTVTSGKSYVLAFAGSAGQNTTAQLEGLSLTFAQGTAVLDCTLAQLITSSITSLVTVASIPVSSVNSTVLAQAVTVYLGSVTETRFKQVFSKYRELIAGQLIEDYKSIARFSPAPRKTVTIASSDVQVTDVSYDSLGTKVSFVAFGTEANTPFVVGSDTLSSSISALNTNTDAGLGFTAGKISSREAAFRTGDGFSIVKDGMHIFVSLTAVCSSLFLMF